jgi:hypothetical protein
MIYLKHYWMRDSQYLTEPGQNGSLQYHPGAGIDGFSVRYWLTDDRGVDYCLSTASDNALVEEQDPGMQILTKVEFDAIVATIPVPEPQPQPPGAPDWKTFKTTALSSPGLNTLLGEVLTVAPVVGTTFPATFSELENGKYDDFTVVWNAINAVVEVPTELITEFTTLAGSCNLPQEFIAIFSAT